VLESRARDVVHLVLETVALLASLVLDGDLARPHDLSGPVDLAVQDAPLAAVVLLGALRDARGRDGERRLLGAVLAPQRRGGALAVRVGEVVLLGRRADLAHEHAQHGDAGGDDGHAGLGVAPDEEVDAGG